MMFVVEIHVIQLKIICEEGYSSADDQVYAVLYETVLKRGKLILLRARGENGNTSESLPEEWDLRM